MIGNPPYVQIQKLPKDVKTVYQNQNYHTFTATGDLYCLFYEQGWQLLKESGLLCYITSNKWMKANYGKKLRSFLISQSETLNVIDFGMTQNFGSATTYTNILLFSKKESDSKTFPACYMQNDYSKSVNLRTYVKNNSIDLEQKKDSSWVILPKKHFEIKKEVVKQGKPLNSSDWDISIYRGVLTGYNDAFYIDETQKNMFISQDPKNAEIIKPLLRGRDVRKYGSQFDKVWMISTFPALNLDIDEYPIMKRYLKEFLPKLKQSGETFIGADGSSQKTRKKTGNEWFETQDQIAYHEEFSKPKIIYPNMTKWMPFFYDKKGEFYTNQKCFILTTTETEPLAYLTAFLNSPLFKFCFKNEFPELLGETYELSKVFFEKIPVKKIGADIAVFFEKLVDYVQFLKEIEEKLVEASYFEQIIDALVYELYFPEEIKAGGISFIEELQAYNLPNISDLTDLEKMPVVHKVFEELYDKEHPIRRGIYFLDSIEIVRHIKESLRK